ncbi:MAG: vWA domain-containing protein [Christensenellales bacterium]
MLVIDTTDSMTRESIGVPIDMARRGAIKCVDALNGNDYAGVITFSDDAQMLVEMTAMGDKKPVLDAINSIETADPNKLTRFTGALRLACDTLKAFDGTKRKHVMFITDGSPADAQAGFEQIAKEMRANGITLSTIVGGGWSTWSTCWKISRISAAAAAIWWKAAGPVGYHVGGFGALAGGIHGQSAV